MVPETHQAIADLQVRVLHIVHHQGAHQVPIRVEAAIAVDRAAAVVAQVEVLVAEEVQVTEDNAID